MPVKFVSSGDGNVHQKEEGEKRVEVEITGNDARKARKRLRGTVRKREPERIGKMGFEVAKIVGQYRVDLRCEPLTSIVQQRENMIRMVSHE